ncbi:MAG: 6-bladed beta-propeller [Tannerellaceae bacterium]|jgi:hypothetical protein|nr:6-bladed beta-propeller [Tannerellaceae bacterium]
MKILILFFTSIIFISCNGKTADRNTDIDSIEELDLYSDCMNYENRLSSIATDVRIIPLCNEPLLNDFHIYDIETCRDNIFISGINCIYKYDINGNFICNIGTAGMGPEEYINIYPPIEIDRVNDIIYVSDAGKQTIILYDFNGKYIRSIPLEKTGCIKLITPDIIALRETTSDRLSENCSLISFIDTKGTITNSYKSNIYPLNYQPKNLGPDASFLWGDKDHYYYLEYGSDTIFQITDNTIKPIRYLTGSHKMLQDEYSNTESNTKLAILSYILRPNAAIFESDENILFKLINDAETYYKVYNKATKEYARTFYKNAATINRSKCKRMDFFIDDILTGENFNPQYQSEGKMIAFISSEKICNNKEQIIDRIKLKSKTDYTDLINAITNLTEYDNSFVMIADLK